MKAVFGIVSLLIVLCVVGILQHKRLKTSAGLEAAASAAGVALPEGGTASAQSQNTEQQVKKLVEESLQVNRPGTGDD